MELIDFLRSFIDLLPTVDMFQLVKISESLFYLMILSFSLLVVRTYSDNNDEQKKPNVVTKN